MQWFNRIAALALVLAATGLPARAQDTIFMTQFNDSAAFLQSYIGNEALGAVARQQAETVAASTAPAELTFGSDPTISEQVRTAFGQGLVAATPDRQAAIEEALSSDWLGGYARDIAQPNGLDPNNVADAYAGYVIASWALVNGETTLSSAGIASFRDTVRQRLSKSAALAELSAADRQMLGEELMYNTVLVMANRVALYQNPNPTLAEHAAAHYGEQFLAAGVDLTTLTLTDAGLVGR